MGRSPLPHRNSVKIGEITIRETCFCKVKNASILLQKTHNIKVMQMHTNTIQRMEKNTCPRKGLDHLMLAKLCKLQGCLVHRCRIRIGWQ